MQIARCLAVAFAAGLAGAAAAQQSAPQGTPRPGPDRPARAEPREPLKPDVQMPPREIVRPKVQPDQEHLRRAQGGAARAEQKDREPAAIEGHAFRPEAVEPTDKRVRALKLPEGFRIEKFAEGLGKPRFMAVGPRGQVYVARRDPGDVLMLVDSSGDGRADIIERVIRVPEAHGLAVRGNRLFIAGTTRLYSAEIERDGSLSRARIVFDDLPDGGQHPNRTIAFGPDGLLYISVGSSCTACNETNPEHATMLQADPEGRRIFARGLRNTIGFAWHPATGEMWGMDHGTDWLGDDKPEEELNRIVAGAHYGWPWVNGASDINPWVAEPPGDMTKEDYLALQTPPALGYTAHAAPMGMVFYTGDMFPQEYRGDAFVANRGSWNRKTPAGYNIVRIRFDEAGRPQEFEDFITGFLVDDNQKHIARPVGLVIARDGSMLISDDSNGVIYRVSYGEGGR
jgi:glucose/arabinose dehydrogenase